MSEQIGQEELKHIWSSLKQAMDAVLLTAWVYDLRARRLRILYGNFEHDSNTLDSIHPDDRDGYLEHFRSVADGTKERDTFMVRICSKPSGIYRHYESTLSTAPDESGQISCVVGSLKDITENLKVETELSQQKKYVTLALEAGGLSVYMYDIARRMFFSLDGETLAGNGLTMDDNLTMMHPDDRAPFLEEFEKVTAGEIKRMNIRLRFRDDATEGGYRYYDTSIIPVHDNDGKLTRVVGTQKDVTRDCFIQTELRLSKQKAELAIAESGCVLWEFDSNTTLFKAENDPIAGAKEPEDTPIGIFLAATHPADHKILHQYIDLMMEGRDTTFHFMLRMKEPGSDMYQYCSVSGSPFQKDSRGRVTKYVGIRKNDTEHYKRTKFLNTILNNIPIPIYIKDRNHRITFCNEECKRVFGNSENSFADNFLDSSIAEKIEKVDDTVFSTGSSYFEQESLTMSDGREMDTLVSKSVINHDDKNLLLCVRWDESLQNELRLKSKVLSISMAAMNAFTWMFNSRDNRINFGDGFEKTGGEAEQLDTVEKYLKRLHSDDLRGFISLAREIRDNDEGNFSLDHRLDLAADGKYEWWEVRGHYETVVSHNGTPYKYLYGIYFNIDEHKRNELALLEHKHKMARLNKQNELVLNNTNSGLVYISTDYIVQWENFSTTSASLSLNAYRKGEVCYKTAYNRTKPCENCVMQQALRSGQIEQKSFELHNGKTIEVFATPVAGEGGSIDGVVVRVDDVTERQKMIRDIEHARKEAEQADKLKSAFLANMSHEIRTPLNAIVGFSELMMTSDDPEEKEDYGRYIKTNNDILLKLINDILDLSKIEAGVIELKPERFDLAEYFNEIAFAMQRYVTNPAVKLTCTNPYEKCVVELDKGRITQLITNYVTNSAKYTPKGFIEMGYGYTGEGIRIYVKDSGIGIEEEKKNRVFNRFEKLDEFAQGTGLGLSICNAIVKAFGGSVGFESEAGKGSEFWAFIPCAAEFPNQHKVNKNQTDNCIMDFDENKGPTEARKTILVAEDILSNYLLIKALLKKEYDLVHALNGQEALDIIRTHHIDLVLMDMKMPVMGGLETTAKIREFDTELPIIALTAHAFESDKTAALEAGCNDYLVKPIDKASLMKTICSHLGTGSEE